MLAMLACCFGLGAYIGGIFGMNLDNTHTLEHNSGGFYTVTAVSTLGLGVLFVGMWLVLLRNNGTFPRRMVLLEEDAVKLR